MRVDHPLLALLPAEGGLARVQAKDRAPEPVAVTDSGRRATESSSTAERPADLMKRNGERIRLAP